MGDWNTSIRTDTIIPTFRGIYLNRFLQLIESVDNVSAEEQRNSVVTELEWCKALCDGGMDRKKYLGMLMILKDVLGQGWRTQYRHRSIYLTRPDYTYGKHMGLGHAVVKEQIRRAFSDERLAKINTVNTAKFLQKMEGPTKGKLSVLDLVTSGKDWVSSLRSLPNDPTLRDLRGIVDPYLQLVKPNERDQLSGQRLMDIWRYFRYLWAIPYQSTPGRNLFYLVRDAARPNHPVIGIAALGNCIIQLSERDLNIGWSVEAIESNLQRRSRTIVRDLPKDSKLRRTTETVFTETQNDHHIRITEYAAKLVNSLLTALDNEQSLISLNGLANVLECKQPTEQLVKRLLCVASEAENARRELLRDTYAREETIKRSESDTSIEEDNQSHLYVRKRAQALADVLFARMTIQKVGIDKTPLQALEALLRMDDGRKALRIGLHSNKKTKIGSNVMDIIVCGAIPPYSEMLGGKLVAMLMASPQVVREYREVYGGQPSQIVSRIAGQNVVRPADLVFLTTTSLYHVGSSQYERIRIPTPHGPEITFEHLGQTEGFGSAVLSSETTNFLRQLTIESEGMKRVNGVFGEGISPKLRMTRDALVLLGIPQDIVLRHNCPRLIYGVKLARNTFEYLRGEEDQPEYLFDMNCSETGTQSVIDHWLIRWFSRRARREESLKKVAVFCPDSIKVSRELTADDGDFNQEVGDAAYG